MSKLKHDAVYLLYPTVKRVSIDIDDNIIAYDENNNLVSVDVNSVNTKTAELETAEETAKQAKEDLKASAKAKLIAGEPLTQEEADTIVL